MTNAEKVTAALRGMKSGLLAGEIAERAHLPPAQVSSALTCLRASKTVLKHAGDTPNKSRYTLNPDIDTDASATAPTRKPAAPRTMREIAIKHVNTTPEPLLLRHIRTTFDLILENADLDAMDPGLRLAFDAHREAIDLARSA